MSERVRLQHSLEETANDPLNKEKQGVPRRRRGRPFARGNPGRPRGSKNKSTVIVETLIGNEAAALGRKAVEKALAGDSTCLKICIDRLAPRRNGRPIDVQLPAIEKPGDVVEALAAIATAVNDGEITAEEAASLVRILDSYAQAVKKQDLIARLEALEAQMKETKR